MGGYGNVNNQALFEKKWVDKKTVLDLQRRIDRYEALLVDIYQDIQGEPSLFWIQWAICQTAPEVAKIANGD